MHPTEALMLSRAIESDRRRELDRRQRWQPDEHSGPTQPRPSRTGFLSFLRAAGPTATKA